MTPTTQRTLLSKNRAEEFGQDVWEQFVVPLFFEELDLQTALKPRLIVGGRGCGKTMLLRYLTHETTFSSRRYEISPAAIKHIGLYWRTDTQFGNAMQKRGIAEDVWESAFSHYVAVVISMEVLSSLESIAQSRFQGMESNDLQSIVYGALKAFDETLPESHIQLKEDLTRRLWAFETWVNDVRKVEQPRFLPGEKFVIALISLVRKSFDVLRNSVFYVYIDEYENLCRYQQRLINTWLKHSQSPLIFNLAVKRNAFVTLDTVGPEPLSDIHDFRQHDIEKLLLEYDFPQFAAEILFHNLTMGDSSLGGLELPIQSDVLRDPTEIESRKLRAYRSKILAAAEMVLPTLQHSQLAKQVAESKPLWNRLRVDIRKALAARNDQSDSDDYMSPSHPEATIVIPALLNRKSMRCDEIMEQLALLKKNQSNHFTGRRNWIHNNFIGSLLRLYAPYGRTCPLYAGFSPYCGMAKGNLRHFLELCHKALIRSISRGEDLKFPIPADIQADAAKQTSTDFLGEIRSFGRRGPQLYTFALRIGNVFEAAHRRASQSEPEQTHFSVTRGDIALTDDDESFLREATKWSLLFEEKSTKKKDGQLVEAIDYVLNPIYAPYFNISFRKRRKVELTTRELQCLIRGNLDEFRSLMRDFFARWQLELDQDTLPLFPDD